MVHGDSWFITGEIIKYIPKNLTIWTSPKIFAWLMILNKIVRAANSPDNPENWTDIIGYATLVLEDLKDG